MIKRKKTIMITSLVVVLIILLGFLGVNIYSEFKDKNNEVNNSNESGTSTTTTTTTTTKTQDVTYYEECEAPSNRKWYTGEIKEVKNDYTIFANNMKKMLAKFDENNYKYESHHNPIIGDYEVSLEKDGSLYIIFGDGDYASELRKLGKYKIADNVLNFEITDIGNGGYEVILFINDDGTVGEAELGEYLLCSGKLPINEDIGYRNIVSFYSVLYDATVDGWEDLIFVDIDGNYYGDYLDN